ncbi:glycolate oxidase subunit GlcF [Roseospirillum parvum]|uniref:Glycolate oxidase iron-sulfur subunit n=1 Tax=Roseospirillum parvum TaxID=83401 RepID=A0A1G7YCV9_9PROT|nr:glycolate oxidase subunit GlcF [Roseospirillum parvum]SDG94159.1 glycolate oxidase iron-sulfur subunit [Roseospirillum parvum]
MKTEFPDHRLAREPMLRQANDILRTCVHCGFCTATCPTYLLLGDELDSPRGRIYLLKQMLEKDTAPSPNVVRHIDRCLTCLSCMTTCPSGVDYMHLLEQGRAFIARNYERPRSERLLRQALVRILPHENRFRAALALSRAAGPVTSALKPRLPEPMQALMDQAPKTVPAAGPASRPGVFPAEGQRTRRVTLLTGCVQPALRPEINEATVRLLTRHGVEVVVAKGAGCCGAVVQHMGEMDKARALARANVIAWTRELEGGGLDAVVINTSGCGTTVKDYGHLLADDPELAEAARRIAGLARDVSEVLADILGEGGLKAPVIAPGMPVAYHAACSLQHGQQIKAPPRDLLKAAGFEVREVAEGHICCGSAGTYSVLEPELSGRLKARKLANLQATGARVVAAGNIGCLTHLDRDSDLTLVHTVELLDWATGGPRPVGV